MRMLVSLVQSAPLTVASIAVLFIVAERYGFFTADHRTIKPVPAPVWATRDYADLARLHNLRVRL